MKLVCLSEGFKYDQTTSTFHLDLNKDGEDDLVKLTGITNVQEKLTQWYKVKIYYSFKVDSNVATPETAKLLAQHLKQDNKHSDQFIELAAEHFVSNYADIANIDLITYPASGSSFNKRLAEKLGSWLGVPIEHTGFLKKSQKDTGVRDTDINAMQQLKSEIYKTKKTVLKHLETYINNQDEIFLKELPHTGKEAQFLVLLRRRLTHLKEMVKAVKTNPDPNALNELINQTAAFWAHNEANKLGSRIRSNIGQNKAGQADRPTKIKNFDFKDKREFLDFLNISPGLLQQLQTRTNVLVIDDNVDYGSTFSRIDKILGSLPNITAHYYAPLVMAV